MSVKSFLLNVTQSEATNIRTTKFCGFVI